MSGVPKFGSGAPKCVECGKSVYKAEEQQHEGKLFHRLCFSIWAKKEAEKEAAKRNEHYSKKADVQPAYFRVADTETGQGARMETGKEYKGGN